MGIKATISAINYTPSHAAQAQAAGESVQMNHSNMLLKITETVIGLNQILAQLNTGNFTANAAFTTSSNSISFATALPSWVASGMVVTDVTNSNALGTVLSGAGTKTLTLQANALHASNGSSDVIQISDANLATYQAQVTALS